MFCLSNLRINKIILGHATNPSKSDSSPEQSNAPNPSVQATKPITSSHRSKLRHRPPLPSVIQIERVVGAGSFRDGEPGVSDVRKSVFDLFLGKAFEGPVERKLRTTGEWLVTNAESRFRTAGKGTLVFVFQWMLPIWAISLLVACGVIKLPFSSPFLDYLLM